jgi:hypothetical protein
MIANLAMTELTSSAIVVFAIQKLKSAKWFPWIEAGKKTGSRVASVIGATMTAIAVNYSWNPQTRVISIAIPTLGVFLLACWHWLNHFATQELMYQMTANRNGSTPPKSA